MTVAFDNLTLSQRVYEHLRDEILADHLLPGTELSEVALSKELAISRGPIREAMGRLSAEGLITMRPRRRAEVRSLTPQELIDAYQVREALEVMAVRLLIPRVTEADLARLEQLIDQMAAHIAEGAVREFFAANVSFHELLCELSGNPKLQQVHHRLEGEIGRFQNRTLALRGSMDDSLTEHRAILAAIRLRDADRAAALTTDHIRVPARRLQAALRDDAPVEPVGASLGEPAEPSPTEPAEASLPSPRSCSPEGRGRGRGRIPWLWQRIDSIQYIATFIEFQGVGGGSGRGGRGLEVAVGWVWSGRRRSGGTGARRGSRRCG